MNIKCHVGKQKLSRLALHGRPDYKPDEPLTLVPFLSPRALKMADGRAGNEGVCEDLYLCEQTMNENEPVRFPITPVEDIRSIFEKVMRTHPIEQQEKDPDRV